MLLKRLYRLRLFVTAATQGAIILCRTSPKGRCAQRLLKSARHVLSVILSNQKLKKERRGLYMARLKKCHRCPLFHQVLKTCGSADSGVSNGSPIGCLCWMPIKAKLEVDCWLRENEDYIGPIAREYGWPDAIRRN